MTHSRAGRPRAIAEVVERIILAAPSARHRIRDVAAQVGVSPFHLARVFRAETGESMHQYLLRVRMNHALARLSDGEVHLSRLAFDLGFSSHSHFSTVFRRHFGESPTRARAALIARRATTMDVSAPTASWSLQHQ